VKTPVLSALDVGLEAEGLTLFADYKGWYNTVSRWAKAPLPEKERFVGVIDNAIEVAKGAGRRLIIRTMLYST